LAVRFKTKHFTERVRRPRPAADRGRLLVR